MRIRRAKKAVSSQVLGVAYVRVSTTEQHLGPQAQMAQIERFCDSEDIALTVVFLDIGISGGKDVADRPGLCAALAFPGATCIVAAKRDRLARDVAIAGDIDRLAAKADKKVMSADGSNDDSDGAALKRDIDAVLSAHERRVIRRRTRDALAIKKARGEALGCAPFGFTRTGADHCAQCAAHSSETHSTRGVHLEPSPAEQAIIARALALHLDGLPVRAIAATLTSEGHLNRQGASFTQPSVYSWLRPIVAAAA